MTCSQEMYVWDPACLERAGKYGGKYAVIAVGI